MKYLQSVKDTSIDLILFRGSGMNSRYNKVKDRNKKKLIN